MKSRKIKLLASLTSLVLVVAVMAVGVWAAGTATATITGSVTFGSVDNILATITTDKSGVNEVKITKDGVTGTPLALTNLDVNQTTGEYVYIISITNDRDVDSEATKPNVTATITLATVADGANYTLTSDKASVEVEPGQTGTIKVTFQVTDLEISIEEAVSVGCTLDLSATA